MNFARLWWCLLLVVPAIALAQPNGVLLVAKPGLRDPNFSETVVLVTQTPDAQTVGVILNRPTTLALEQLIGEGVTARNAGQRIYAGGPVMRRTAIALFHAQEPPGVPAFHVLRNVYLTMHPAGIQPLLESPDARYRLFAGFSGWAPRQLEAELRRGDWYVLPATEALVFRADSSAMWRELVEKARARPAAFIQ